jgi:hypothetical protein
MGNQPRRYHWQQYAQEYLSQPQRGTTFNKGLFIHAHQQHCTAGRKTSRLPPARSSVAVRARASALLSTSTPLTIILGQATDQR